MPTRSKTRKSEADKKKASDLLDRQDQDLDDLWKAKDADFFDERAFYERVIWRREKIELDDRFKEYGQGIQSLATMLEDDLITHINICNLDEPKLDCIPKVTATNAKEDVEDVRVWLAQSMARQNEGKILGRGVNISQFVNGVACVEKGWHYPGEPGEEHFKSEMGEDYYDPADSKKVPEKAQVEAREKAREKFFQSSENHCFTLKNVNMNEMRWYPLLNPKLFLRKFEIGFTEFRELKRNEKLGGGKAGLDAVSGKVIFGESDSEDNGDATQNAARKFEILIRNHQEDKKWICSKWVRGSEDTWDDAELYDEYVIPGGRPMYFIIPSGNFNPMATNPHLMYRAPIYSEVVLVYERNYINTLKLALARMQLHDAFFYMDGSKFSAELRSALEADGFISEGAGENEKWVFKRTTTDSSQIVAVPGEIKAWPFPETPNLDTRLAQIEMELERVRPNRLQIGAAISAAKEGTATGLLDQKQASALPYEAHIDFEEMFWEENAKWECAAMLYWQEEAGEVTKPYYYRTTGEEPVMGGSKPAGKEVYIDADKLKRDFEIRVRKRNKTQAEKMQDDLAAYQDKAQGTITEEQLLKRLDFDDPQKQLAELQREKYRLMVEQELAPVEAMMVKVYASALWGTNLTELPLPQGMPAPGSNPEKPPAANEPAGAALPLAGQVGPAVTPAPVTMPGGMGTMNPGTGM